MQTSEPRIAIVGASSAGLQCACRLARLRPTWAITVIEEHQSFGHSTSAVPYLLSGEIPEEGALRRAPDGSLGDAAYFSQIKGLTILTGWTVLAVDPAQGRLTAQRGEERMMLHWDELVLATGTRPRSLAGQLDHPRIRPAHGVRDMARLFSDMLQGAYRRIAIVGAGYRGCQMAEVLSEVWDSEVTLIEAAPTPLSRLVDPEVAEIVAWELCQNNIALVRGWPVEGVEAREDHIILHGPGRSLSADVAVVAAGVEPRVDLARSMGLDLGVTGAIAVDQGATMFPHVWAVGDCAEGKHVATDEPFLNPGGSEAGSHGRLLAEILAGLPRSLPPTTGASALRIFNSAVAMAGITRDHARSLNIETRSVWITARDRASYWPEPMDMALQLIYSPSTRRILGVQVAGTGDLTRRTDLASLMLSQAMTIDQAAQLEHTFTAPLSPAAEPLTVAARLALAQEDEGLTAFSPAGPWETSWLLDVRRPEEGCARPLPRSARRVRAISQETLGDRLGELERRDWLVVCDRGRRSAEAARALGRRGFNASYLGGGLRWLTMMGRQADE